MTPMPETTAVVKPDYQVEEAYRMGHDEFTEFDLPDEAEPNLDGFRDSARYANHILPRLRAMAGHGDPGGHGTYTESRKIAAIKPGCEEDHPAEAELMDSSHLFERLVEAWTTGAYDGMEDTYDPDSVRW